MWAVVFCVSMPWKYWLAGRYGWQGTISQGFIRPQDPSSLSHVHVGFSDGRSPLPAQPQHLDTTTSWAPPGLCAYPSRVRLPLAQRSTAAGHYGFCATPASLRSVFLVSAGESAQRGNMNYMRFLVTQLLLVEFGDGGIEMEGGQCRSRFRPESLTTKSRRSDVMGERKAASVVGNILVVFVTRQSRLSHPEISIDC